MITVNLEKKDLINLIKGIDPSYEQMGQPLVAANGTHSGSYDRWSWNYKAFEDCSEQEIYDAYVELTA